MLGVVRNLSGGVVRVARALSDGEFGWLVATLGVVALDLSGGVVESEVRCVVVSVPGW